MAVKFNPFTGSLQLDEVGSGGGGSSYLDGEVATYADLSLDAGVAPLNTAWLVRTASGVWPVSRKQAGIYIRTATGGSNRDADYTYAGTMPDVFSDANFTVYDDADSTKNLQFQLSGIATNTTRTLTIPNASGTLGWLQSVSSITVSGGHQLTAARNQRVLVNDTTGSGGGAVYLPATGNAEGDRLEVACVGLTSGALQVRTGQYNYAVNVSMGLNQQRTFIYTSGAWTVQSSVESHTHNGIVSVKDFGAVGNGVANDTAAIQAAAQSVATGGIVYFPKGTYLCGGLTLSNLFAVTFQGANKFTSVLKLTQTGTLLSLPNAQWCRLEKLGFQTNAAPHSIAPAYGVSFSNSAGNNVVDDCLFSGFSKNGLRIEGTVGSQLSGHKVFNSMFLGNAEEQLFTTYCNDFHMENNQFGRLAGITLATVGCYLDNSSAGTYSGNYHWDNVVGFKAESCNYNTYACNRFEESSQENVLISAGSYTLFCDNKVHTASKGSSGSHDNVVVTGATYFSATGNSLFQWSGNSRWGININTGCEHVTLGKNQIQGFSASFGPVRVDGTVGAISGDFELFGLTGAQSAGGQTTYIGAQANTFDEGAASFTVPRRCQPVRVYAATDAAPGAGQSYTYTLRVNAADTSYTTQASASAFSAAANTPAPAVLVPKDGGVSVKLATSASAAAARHRFYISFVEY